MLLHRDQMSKKSPIVSTYSEVFDLTKSTIIVLLINTGIEYMHYDGILWRQRLLHYCMDRNEQSSGHTG